MPNQSLVSVIIPVWNAGEFVEGCVRSVLEQTYEPLEVVLVNDGSTDSSLDICRRLAAADPRITLIDQPNAGPNAARNRGLQAARGEFVAFVDADDTFYTPDTLALNMPFFADPAVDIVSFPQYREHSPGGPLRNKPEQLAPRLLSDKLTIFTNWYNGRLIDGHFPGKIFRKSLFDGWQLIETIRFTEDHYDIPNICRRLRRVQISGVGGYVYSCNPSSAIHSSYTTAKRRGQFFSELSIYRYLRELHALAATQAEFYNRALENAYYLCLTPDAALRAETLAMLRASPRASLWSGNALVRLLKLLSILLGHNAAITLTAKIAKLYNHHICK